MKTFILLAGATGYVGGELLKALLAADYRVRCLARRPAALSAKQVPGLEVMAGDVLDPATVQPAMAGIHTAYYLVHSMGSTQRTGAGCDLFLDSLVVRTAPFELLRNGTAPKTSSFADLSRNGSTGMNLSQPERRRG